MLCCVLGLYKSLKISFYNRSQEESRSVACPPCFMRVYSRGTFGWCVICILYHTLWKVYFVTSVYCAGCIICHTLCKVRISMTRAYSAYSHASSVFTQCGHETSDPVSSSLTSNEASICLIFSSRHFLFIHKYFTHFPVYLYLCWHCTCTLISIITSVYLTLPPSSPLHLFQKYFTLLQVYVVNSVYIQVYICICVWICVCVWICFIYPHHSLANWCYGLMAAHRDPTCCSIRNALHCSSFLLLMIILIDFTVAYVLHLDTHCTVYLLFPVSCTV